VVESLNRGNVWEVCIDYGNGPVCEAASFYSENEAKDYSKKLAKILVKSFPDINIHTRLRDSECNGIAEGPASWDKIMRFCTIFNC